MTQTTKKEKIKGFEVLVGNEKKIKRIMDEKSGIRIPLFSSVLRIAYFNFHKKTRRKVHIKRVKGSEEKMLVIKGHLDGLNEYTRATRANKFEGAAMKRKNEDRVRKAINAALDKAEIIPIMDNKSYPLEVKIAWYDDTCRDFDNVVFGKKFILDAMKKAGIIKDDSRKYIKKIEDIIITDKENPRIEVTFKKNI